MNSADATKENEENVVAIPSGSGISDTNANPSLTTDESKGAIPKVKPVKTATKKTNNNVEESPNCSCDSSSRPGNSTSKRNGYSKTGSPNCYMSICNGSDKESSRRSRGHAPPEDFVVEPFVSLYNTSSSYLDLSKEISCYQDGSSRDSSDSSSDENDLSVSDDGCIYTYKGDNAADLPNSFFHLDIAQVEDIAPEPIREENNSSPEMDFLEMDFDPGPSGDADSDSNSNEEMENAASLPLDCPQPTEVTAEEVEVVEEEVPPRPRPVFVEEVKAGPSRYTPALSPVASPTPLNASNFCEEIFRKELVELAESRLLPIPCSTDTCTSDDHFSQLRPGVEKASSSSSSSSKTLRVFKGHQKGELVFQVCIGDADALNDDLHERIIDLELPPNVVLAQRLNNGMSANRGLFRHKEKHPMAKQYMVWEEHEAYFNQINQVGPSACGATAVLNVLRALGFPLPCAERAQEAVNTQMRATSCSLTQYLLSRSNAGCGHRGMISGLYHLSEKRVYSRFFSMYPPRIVNLTFWLGHWIKLGAVPIATLNLQKCDGKVPDSWHHQMVFGVGNDVVYLTNPFECVSAAHLMPQLSSEQTLLVRTEDVVSRFNQKVDWEELTGVEDERWQEINVLGQIAKVMRQHQRRPPGDRVVSSHIKIPNSYSSGITLALPMDSPAFELLREAPELPLLHAENAASALDYYKHFYESS